VWQEPGARAVTPLPPAAIQTAPPSGEQAPIGSATAPRRPVREAAQRHLPLFVLTTGLAAAATVAGVIIAFDRSSPSPPAETGHYEAATGKYSIPTVLSNVLPGVVAIEARLPDGRRLTGTGTVISQKGEVLTNDHVVAGASSITVTPYGTGRGWPARAVGAAPDDDLALLRVDGAGELPTVRLGSSAHVPVGATVVAVGYALGRAAGTPTATEGIVSAEGRSVTTESRDGHTVILGDMLQTDALIDPGNSGGPLLDTAAQVIGINTAVGDTTPGTGFAIPIDRARALLGQLRQGGIATGGTTVLGIAGVTLTPALRSAFGSTPTSGVIVAEVMPKTPGERAGLAAGDVITEVDGTPLINVVQFRQLAVGTAAAGRSVQLQVVRGASTTTFAVEPWDPRR
jgi:S1-C subfamily serine protease